VWVNNEQWFYEKGIPWKKGWILYGPPGTGKSSLARSFAEDLNMPIFIYNLAELSNHAFLKAWMEMLKNTPCIALIEDIDNVFHGRENIVNKRNSVFSVLENIKNNQQQQNNNQSSELDSQKLSFDILINCIDGAIKSEGVFTIITTNDIEKIDPALGSQTNNLNDKIEFGSTRPGRIDKVIKLDYMEWKEKKKLRWLIIY
jgi:SpoVK/Ycf46/Vps4 family AAA+-type ATPase